MMLGEGWLFPELALQQDSWHTMAGFFGLTLIAYFDPFPIVYARVKICGVEMELTSLLTLCLPPTAYTKVKICTVEKELLFY